MTDRIRPAGPADAGLYRRWLSPFASARSAIFHYLSSLRGARAILIPAYFGASRFEGSGVLDPIADAGLLPWLYPVNRRLEIDVDSFMQALSEEPDCVMFIHYFGRPDPNFEYLANICISRGIPVLEDSAHALFSDLIDGVVGRAGSFSAISIHKSVPAPGGLGAWRHSDGWSGNETLTVGSPLHSFDLAAMALVRKQNLELAYSTLQASAAAFQPLWAFDDWRGTPYGLPLLLTANGARDDVYHGCNSAGVPIASIYHTMPDIIDSERFPDSHFLSSRLVMFPVHQEMTPSQIVSGLGLLQEIASGLPRDSHDGDVKHHDS